MGKRVIKPTEDNRPRWKKVGGGVHKHGDGQTVRQGEILYAEEWEIADIFKDMFELIEKPKRKRFVKEIINNPVEEEPDAPEELDEEEIDAPEKQEEPEEKEEKPKVARKRAAKKKAALKSKKTSIKSKRKPKTTKSKKTKKFENENGFDIIPSLKKDGYDVISPVTGKKINDAPLTLEEAESFLPVEDGDEEDQE